jgi:hypothetical protein
MPSSVVRRFAYDPATRRLEVLFVTGRRYRYSEVPPAVAKAFRAAFSTGRFFNAEIRDRYAVEELGRQRGGAQLSSSTSQ